MSWQPYKRIEPHLFLRGRVFYGKVTRNGTERSRSLGTSDLSTARRRLRAFLRGDLQVQIRAGRPPVLWGEIAATPLEDMDPSRVFPLLEPDDPRELPELKFLGQPTASERWAARIVEASGRAGLHPRTLALAVMAAVRRQR